MTHNTLPESTKNVLAEVLTERERQNSKWGEQNHPAMVWNAILGEEVGEVAQAILEAHFSHMSSRGPRSLTEARTELIQVAAVAVAAVESMDRNELKADYAD